MLEHHRGRDVAWVGDQAMYFETGQGSALSAGAHHGVDQLTLEARAYGVARAFDPFLVNSVVGFIGPEYLFDERQIIRAGLEDHFMGKLLGLPMGVDVCYTNHAAADQNSADNLLLLLAAAGCNYFMGVPCADDVMLNYQSTSFHDALAVRRLFGLRPAPEFAAWLEAQGLPAGRPLDVEDGRARGRMLEQLGRSSSKPRGSPDARRARAARRASSNDDRRRPAAARDGLCPGAGPAAGRHSRTSRCRLSIICILAGGVTSFHLGLCSVGGASIGLGWPLVGLFALAVAATMGQLASAFPTAGGLYHWAAILGGRGWGWATAWFNLAGLITVLAAINVGTYRFAMGALVPRRRCRRARPGGPGDRRRPDHRLAGGDQPPGHRRDGSADRLQRLLDPPGRRGADGQSCWPLPRAGPVAAGDVRELQRHGGRRRLAGDRGLGLLFALGLLLPAYTITGFDASAHAAEETIRRLASVPRGIVRSVLVSGVAGWILLCAVVLAAPSLSEAACAGRRGIPLDHERRASRAAGYRARRRDRRGPVPLRAGHGDLGLADGVCLRPRRRPALLPSGAMGLPQAAIAGRRDLDRRGGVRPLHLYTRRSTRRSPRSARSSSMSRTCCRRPWAPGRTAGPGRRWVPGTSAAGIGRWPCSAWSAALG